jgi:cytochrome c
MRKTTMDRSLRALLAGVSVLFATSALAAAGATVDVSKGEAVVKGSDCLSCHAVDHKVVGPAFQDVAKKYASQPQAEAALIKKVKAGGSGVWGQVPMTPHPQLSDADLKAAVDWVLAQGAGGKSAAAAPAAKAAGGGEHHYKNASGQQVTADFQVYVDDKPPKVTPDVFTGYENYNSYCFRCHGGDAVGGDIAPDLRNSLKMGMSWDQFLSTAMAGRPDKGMPSWAGFFQEKDLRQIYEYIKARQLDLVPTGRPASAQD